MEKLSADQDGFTSHSLQVLAVQDEDEEAEPEKPAKKAVKEEAVFAGNKNLRSEDQKYREIHDDRHAPLLPAVPLLLTFPGTAGPVWVTTSDICRMLKALLPDAALQALLLHAWDAFSRDLLQAQ